MSYYDTYLRYKAFDFDKILSLISSDDVLVAINRNKQDEKQLLALLSPAAEDYLEEMASLAHSLTLNNFGKTIQLYTPMYLSNYCDNYCAYCGFNHNNQVSRRKLTLEEVEREALAISSTGLEHILILTGESKEMSPLTYIKDCVKILRKYFSSISIEIYALSESEYSELIDEGVDGLTIYQETYDELVYAAVHKGGPKQDYLFRLNAPQRAAKEGIRNVNIGVLLGLNNWRKEIFFLGLHAKYLQDNFCGVEVGVSVPRLKSHLGDFKIPSEVKDKNMAQIITALRIFLPRLSISLSTREPAQLREDLLPLGITRISAGSSTRVGGHAVACDESFNLAQFEISDTRNVEEIKTMLAQKRYQPVLKDWMLY